MTLTSPITALALMVTSLLSNCACRRSSTTLPISAKALCWSSTTQAPTRLVSDMIASDPE